MWQRLFRMYSIGMATTPPRRREATDCARRIFWDESIGESLSAERAQARERRAA